MTLAETFKSETKVIEQNYLLFANKTKELCTGKIQLKANLNQQWKHIEFFQSLSMLEVGMFKCNCGKINGEDQRDMRREGGSFLRLWWKLFDSWEYRNALWLSIFLVKWPHKDKTTIT